MKAWLVTLLMASLALSGCADSDPEVESEPEPTIQDDPQNATIMPTPWAVGDYFGHHLFFSAQDTEGYHIDVIVDGETDDSWHLVTDDLEVAIFEEVLDIPITGDLAKADLETTAFGGQSKVYDFPLFDGKTWTGNVKYGFFDTEVYDLTFTATYAEDVTPFGDGRPGFKISGALSNGTVVLETDYDPSFGWYNDYVLYPESGVGSDFLFRSIHMGWGHNWTGTAYDFSSNELVDEGGQMILPAGQVQNVLQPMQIQVSEQSTHLVALQHCFAFAGVNDARLRSPSGANYDCQALALPDGPDPNGWPGVGDGDFYLIDHEPGEWLYNRASAGFVAGGGLQLWELTQIDVVF